MVFSSQRADRAEVARDARTAGATWRSESTGMRERKRVSLPSRGAPPRRKGSIMAKSQKKSNKEVRKPKAEKEPKANASNPTTKGKPVEMTTLK
jgi:hypothetical protein